nr:MAG TPA: tail protein [Caudoviricetes sp.]
MSRHLHDLVFRQLVPESIRSDSQIAAAADAISPFLQTIVRAVPNLLIYGRLEEQDPAGMLAPLRRLTEARSGLKALSTEELEQLAWQWHVDFRDAAKTNGKLRAFVLNSIPWHRIKGTPKSLLDALALYGIDAELEEDGTGDQWASYQIHLKDDADADEVRTAAIIAREMQPARCRLYRVWNDFWDTRPIKTSDGPRLSEGWLSFYSGTAVDKNDDMLAAVGIRSRLGNEQPDFYAWLFHELTVTLTASREYGWRLSYFRLSDARDEPAGYVLVFNENVFGTAHKGWVSPIAAWNFSKVRLVLSDSEPLGSLNGTCLGPVRARSTKNPWQLGSVQLSETDPETSLDTIYEHFEQTAAAGSIAPAMTASGAVVSDALSGAAVSRQTELAEWPADNTRRWWPRYGLTITRTEV